ncbi:hypothetical protein N7468_007445 [Penicillium chermesinum]|uniref:Acyl-CoA thioesterase-like N-terminal HotDog domain-containing protein n=1 Tax=Penicillium chermesinum TaxID=63820 RepID=A0A9W9TM71_9EURO|nr:uncharacterized protein N7468_007445 [Penicillium chermesinum]KAJ5226220.1 hypothetical protein N7468_007445 [Penicillium chermesinum]
MSSGRSGDRGPRETMTAQSFVDLMALERLENVQISYSRTSELESLEAFQSKAVPFNPGEGARAFGGHVYAQSAYAASKTVGKGFVVHSMTGSFILGGRLDIPFTYMVRRLRDGFMYCTRSVETRQDGQVCFTGVCSFKRGEGTKSFNHQPRTPSDRFGRILSSKSPDDRAVSPEVDAEWWAEVIREADMTEREFPGVDVRKIDMEEHNKSKDVQEHPEKYRQLTQYRLRGSPDEDPNASLSQIMAKDRVGEYDNLYACAHMYSSDKNSVMLIPRALGLQHWSDITSLTLMVVIHQHSDALRMIDWGNSSPADGNSSEIPMKWFFQEGWTPPVSGKSRTS